jgi:hypothetical protein
LGAQGVPRTNVYQHVYKEAKREAAGKMDALLAAAVEARRAVATKPWRKIRSVFVELMEPPAGIEPATC